MAIQSKRDYSLSGGIQQAVELNDDQLEDRVESDWWSPDLSREALKTLMQRRNGPGLRDFTLWIPDACCQRVPRDRSLGDVVDHSSVPDLWNHLFVVGRPVA